MSRIPEDSLFIWHGPYVAMPQQNLQRGMCEQQTGVIVYTYTIWSESEHVTLRTGLGLKIVHGNRKDTDKKLWKCAVWSALRFSYVTDQRTFKLGGVFDDNFWIFFSSPP